MGQQRAPRPRLSHHFERRTEQGWHEYWAARLSGAPCRRRPDLPWTSDDEPSRGDLVAMGLVCDSCPVRIACGEYALDPHLPALGGMYAGVWIPWKQPGKGRSGAHGWAEARTELRRRLRTWVDEAFEAIASGRSAR